MKIDDLNILTAKTFVFNEDWKTAAAKHQSCIPQDAKVKFLGNYCNYYGKWIEVEYNNDKYYVDPSKFEGDYVVSKDLKFDPISNSYRTILITKNNKRYLLREQGEIQELL